MIYTKRHFVHLLRAFHNCWLNLFWFFCPTHFFSFSVLLICWIMNRIHCYFGMNCSSVVLKMILLYLCNYVCVSVGRIIELESERVIAFSAARNTLRGWRLVSWFLHILWLIVPFLQGQWKETKNNSEQHGWLLQRKKSTLKPHLHFGIRVFLHRKFSFNTDSCLHKVKCMSKTGTKVIRFWMVDLFNFFSQRFYCEIEIVPW